MHVSEDYTDLRKTLNSERAEEAKLVKPTNIDRMSGIWTSTSEPSHHK